MSRPILGLMVLLLLGGCTETITHETSDGSITDGSIAHDNRMADLAVDRTADQQATGPALRIHVKGDLTPVTFTDGLAGQTPKSYTMGLVRFELMRSATDPSPVTVFDHGATPVQVDMLSTTLAGSAPIADLTPGTFTHGRALLAYCIFTVVGTVHAGLSLSGDLTVTGALSDTTINSKSYQQNQADYTFKAGSIQQTLPGTLPPLPSVGGGSVVQEEGKTWLVFSFPSPIVLQGIVSGDLATPRDQSATIIYKVFESFRWQDQTKPGYAAGVFDVDALAMSFEPVVSFGATGYSVVIE